MVGISEVSTHVSFKFSAQPHPLPPRSVITELPTQVHAEPVPTSHYVVVSWTPASPFGNNLAIRTGYDIEVDNKEKVESYTC